MTDRTLRTKKDLDTLAFDGGSSGNGLLPVVVQDHASGEVLMLAFANRQALEKTLESGQMHFWSRRRNELWKKGETSGNTLALVSLHADCDSDSVLARVIPAGPTCHTNERTCFGDGASAAVAALGRLDRTLASRAQERPAGSYTVRLLDDRNLRLKKLGEETAELVAALATREDKAADEGADLLYHLLVALRAEGITAGDLLAALEKRGA